MTEVKQVFTAIKSFLDFTEDDAARLAALRPWVETHGPAITDTFYATIEATPALAPYVNGKVDHLKKTHIQWMLELVGGTYDDAYFESRWRIGRAHVRIGLDPIWVDGTMALIRNETLLGLAKNRAEVEQLVESQASLLKACDLDLAIINLAYTEDRWDRLCNFTGLKRSLIENVVKMAG